MLAFGACGRYPQLERTAPPQSAAPTTGVNGRSVKVAGTADVIHRCYTGLEMRGDVLRLNPRLPENVDSLQLSIQYRDRELGLVITQKEMKIDAAADWAAPLSIEVCGQRVELTASGSVTLDLEQVRHTPPHHHEQRKA